MLKLLANLSRITLRATRRLASDRKGATVVEFAMLLPPLALIVVGTIDFGRGFADKFGLEQAAQRTIEMATVGAVGSDYQFLRPEAAAAAGVPLANVTVDQWLECVPAGSGEGTRQPNFDDTCPDGEMVARFVSVTIVRDYMPSFDYGPITKLFSSRRPDGSIRLTADSSVRVQ